MLQKDVLLQKWFDLQSSNCNTKTAFCNKISISQYLVFLHPTSSRLEYLCKFDRILYEKMVNGGKIAMKNDTRTFSSSLYSFKLNLIQGKSQRVAFCNKISISSYSSNIDPQTSKLMLMDDFYSNPLENIVESG